MFKNLWLYRIGAEIPESAESLAEALETGTFIECGASQAVSLGWVPPRGFEHGALVEAINGHWILKLQIEQRILPPAVVARKVEEMAKAIEDSTGRKPGKKQTKELKEQATLELLPQAFTRRSVIPAWIDPAARMLAVDACSQGKADELVTLLIKQVPVAMNLHLIQTAEAPAACMAAWLLDGAGPGQFTIDREGELKSEDEMRSVVKYTRHTLDTDEIRAHLRSGKRPTKLAMTFADRVSFVLTDTLQVKKIAFLDLVFEGQDKPAKDEAFDADATLATAELSALVAQLLEVLGGEMDLPILQAASAPAHLASDGPDPLYDKAVEVVLSAQRASISTVQRHLQIGYNRAARLLEAMQLQGVVSAMSSDGHRDVLKKAVMA